MTLSLKLRSECLGNVKRSREWIHGSDVFSCVTIDALSIKVDFFLGSGLTLLSCMRTITGNVTSPRQAFWPSAPLAKQIGSWQPVFLWFLSVRTYRCATWRETSELGLESRQ